MKLYHSNLDIENEKDLTLFIQKYLLAGNPATIHEGDICSSYKRRSFSDIRDLYVNYNPEKEISMDDMINALANVNVGSGSVNIRFCNTPWKVVIFWRQHASAWNNLTPDGKFKYYSEYYGETGKDGITMKHVRELLNNKYKEQNASQSANTSVVAS